MGAKGINATETQLHNAQITGGIKRERGTLPKESTLLTDYQELKKMRRDKENKILKCFEVEETSRDWS